MASGPPTDPHWRHHPLRVCGKVLQQPASVLCNMGRAGEKASRFHAIGPSVADSRLLTLNTCPLGKILYVPGVASTPGSATSLIGRSLSAGLIGGLFCLACGVPDSLPARPVIFSRWTSVANPIAQEIIEWECVDGFGRLQAEDFVCKARFATSASGSEQGQRGENNDNFTIPSCERSSRWLQIMPGQLILITWIA